MPVVRASTHTPMFLVGFRKPQIGWRARRGLGDDYGDNGGYYYNGSDFYPVDTGGGYYGSVDNFVADPSVDLSSSEDLGLGPADYPSDPSSDPSQFYDPSIDNLPINTDTVDPTQLAPDPFMYASDPVDESQQDPLTGQAYADETDAQQAAAYQELVVSQSVDQSDIDPLTGQAYADETAAQQAKAYQELINYQAHGISAGDAFKQIHSAGPSAGGSGGASSGGASGGGSGSGSPAQKPKPQIQATISPTQPAANSTATLNWQTQNADSVAINGMSYPPAGQLSFQVGTTAQQVVLVATGPGGNTQTIATVTPVNLGSRNAPTVATVPAVLQQAENWLTGSTIFKGVPNWTLLAGGAAGLILLGGGSSFGSGGGSRRRNPSRRLYRRAA